MKKIRVSASTTYDVTITREKNDFDAIFGKTFSGDKIAIFTDENVERLYGRYFDGSFGGFSVYKKVLPSGEKTKNGHAFLSLLGFLAENGFSKQDCIIAFGGGVISDLSGFVASAYMRGIPFFSVPTTLLSTIDASVGGKTAIDLPQGKNLCGAFYQPSGVYVDLDFLASLPPREIESGRGELLKYAFLTGDFISCENEDSVARCIAYKRDIVERDERDCGKRKLLNLGHTVGHAAEYLSDYSLSHGACVAKGIASSIAVSEKLYNLPSSTVTEMKERCRFYGHDVSLPYAKDEIMSVIEKDKKRGKDGVTFVTLCGIGKPKTEYLSFERLKELLP